MVTCRDRGARCRFGCCSSRVTTCRRSCWYTGVGGAIVAIIVGTLLRTSSEPLAVGSTIGAFERLRGVKPAGLAPLFPLLFIYDRLWDDPRFHSLVSSDDRQTALDNETDARLIGYGGDASEGLLAAVALSTLAVWGIRRPRRWIGAALPNFASGGGLVSRVSAFPRTPVPCSWRWSSCHASTTTAVRLGRYMMEDFVGTPAGGTERYRAEPRSARSRGRLQNPTSDRSAYLLVVSTGGSSSGSCSGGANQLLAALALLTATSPGSPTGTDNKQSSPPAFRWRSWSRSPSPDCRSWCSTRTFT